MRTPYRTIKWNHSTWGVPQEEYDELLERYNTKSGLVQWVRTYPMTIYWWDVSYAELWRVSWIEGNKYYCFVVYRAMRQSNGYYNIFASWSVKNSNSDLSHVSNHSVNNTNQWSPRLASDIYTNGSSILVHGVCPHSAYERYDEYYNIVWNYKWNNQITFTKINKDTDIPAWYTVINKNERVSWTYLSEYKGWGVNFDSSLILK